MFNKIFLVLVVFICGSFSCYSQSFPTISDNNDKLSIGINESTFLYAHSSFSKNIDLSLFHTTYIDYLKYQSIQFEGKFNLFNKWNSLMLKTGFGYTLNYGSKYYKVWTFIQIHYLPVKWLTLFNQSALLNSTDYQMHYFNLCGIKLSILDSVAGYISYGNTLMFRNYEETADIGFIFKSDRISAKSGLQFPKNNPNLTFTRLHVSFAYILKYIH